MRNKNRIIKIFILRIKVQTGDLTSTYNSRSTADKRNTKRGLLFSFFCASNRILIKCTRASKSSSSATQNVWKIVCALYRVEQRFSTGSSQKYVNVAVKNSIKFISLLIHTFLIVKQYKYLISLIAYD